MKTNLLFAKTNLLLLFAMLTGTALNAQVKPNSDWRTIKTARFYIHYTPDLEEVARRAAVQAETAYDELSKLLTPPRGKIDIVISDDVDFSNGYATPYPSNRIGVYATPPVFEGPLRFTDDPTELVITHELTHVFHLDRARGIWGGLQKVFGRYPLFFPNLFHPRWLVEGLAVYYESRVTGSGRVVGSEHHMIARSAALGHRFPRIDQLSLASPHFPYGYGAYAYGSLFMDYLARTYGDTSMRKFVEASSRRLLPWTLNGPARRAFGTSLTSAYRTWAEALMASAASSPHLEPMPEWRDLTVDGAYANFPRWLDDSTLIYTGTPGRESYGAYKLTLPSQGTRQAPSAPSRERVGRRHTRSPNAILPGASLLYSQLEFTSPYTERSDLYVDRAGGGTQRLTRGARLAIPDARGDGLIAAVQVVTAGTRIALVSPDGSRVLPITSGGPDEQWTEPRWSPDGKHLAAVRWTRGGTSEIVVIDTTGRILQSLIRERAVSSAPAWSPDGRYVYFASDRSGIANLYRVAFRAASDASLAIPAPLRVSDARTGLFEPQLSPNGRELSAVVFKADGYHIGVAPIQDSTQHPVAIPNAELRARVAPREAPPIARSQAPSAKYSPWRLLLPRWFFPIFDSALDTNSARFGAVISGEDIVGRHSYNAALLVPTDNSGLTGAAYYRNSTLGVPVLELYGSQDWENRGAITNSSQQQIGTLRRRIRDATLAFNFPRPRVRTFSYLNVGLGYEARSYATDPDSLLNTIDPLFLETYYYPRVTTSAGWSNTQRPLFSVSPEDGVSLASTLRNRWRTGAPATLTASVVASAAGYKSLDLPGFAHHVIALHAAGGVQDNRGTGYFEVGGVSGGTLDVLPGYLLGEGRRTFGVRGFPAGSLAGIRAFQGSAEYRAPFRLPGRGLGTLPLFLDRVSVSVFGDAGSAWCPGVFAVRPAPSTSLCTAQEVGADGVLTTPHLIASAGAELNITAAVLNWDAPYRWRFGFAVPVAGREFAAFGPPKPSAYFAVGASF